MELVWGEGYYSVDQYPLRDGMRAAASWPIYSTPIMSSM
jgi:hypothetical protein